MKKRRTKKDKGQLLFAFEIAMHNGSSREAILAALGFTYDQYCEWHEDEKIMDEFDKYFAPWLADQRGK